MLPVGLERLLVEAIGILPVVWMQAQKPFYIFSVLVVALPPDQLSLQRRQILGGTQLWQYRWITVGLVSVIMAWQLAWLYDVAPLFAPLVSWSNRGLGLLIAGVGFLSANLFLQIPAFAGMMLVLKPSHLDRLHPIPAEGLSQAFTIAGKPVSQLLDRLTIQLPATADSTSNQPAEDETVPAEATAEDVGEATTTSETATEPTANESPESPQIESTSVEEKIESTSVEEKADVSPPAPSGLVTFAVAAAQAIARVKYSWQSSWDQIRSPQASLTAIVKTLLNRTSDPTVSQPQSADDTQAPQATPTSDSDLEAPTEEVEQASPQLSSQSPIAQVMQAVQTSTSKVIQSISQRLPSSSEGDTPSEPPTEADPKSPAPTTQLLSRLQQALIEAWNRFRTEQVPWLRDRSLQLATNIKQRLQSQRSQPTANVEPASNKSLSNSETTSNNVEPASNKSLSNSETTSNTESPQPEAPEEPPEDSGQTETKPTAEATAETDSSDTSPAESPSEPSDDPTSASA